MHTRVIQCTCMLVIISLVSIDQMALRCEYVDSNGCIYRYYVGVNEETLGFTDVHVEFRRCEFFVTNTVCTVHVLGGGC